MFSNKTGQIQKHGGGVKHRPKMEVFQDKFCIQKQDYQKERYSKAGKTDQHVLCVKVKIIKVVYDQMHDARDSFSQWVDVRSYT